MIKHVIALCKIILFKRRNRFQLLKISFIICVTVALFQISYIFEHETETTKPTHSGDLSPYNAIKRPRQFNHLKGKRRRNVKIIPKYNNNSMKYILLWTPKMSPLSKIYTRGQSPLFNNNCEHINCYITSNRSLLKDQTKFDAIIFSVIGFWNQKLMFPKERSPRQKYIAASIEPASKHPVVDPKFDNYFNWTWTYKLDSDIPLRRFLIYDSDGEVIGPKIEMKWAKLEAVNDVVKEVLFRKSQAVVWLADCSLKNRVALYISTLRTALEKYELTLDCFGECCHSSCGNNTTCYDIIYDNYYFYLSFEDGLDRDYVTAKLLVAVNNFAIPIVFGLTDYSRFLPPGSYLNARNTTAQTLANKISEVTRNSTLHEEYFKWVNHYNYEPTPVGSEFCNLCTALNNEEKVRNVTVYKEFRTWWNGVPLPTIKEMLMSLFKTDKQLQTSLGNYSAICEVFKRKYFDAGNGDSGKIFVFDMKDFNISTTDFHTADGVMMETTDRSMY